MPDSRRPKLSLPYTVLSDRDTVRLIAGEDFRYTLEGPRLAEWLPGLLRRADGTCKVDDLLSGVEPVLRAPARDVLARLYAERVIVDGSALQAHAPAAPGVELSGQGPLREALAARLPSGAPDGGLVLLCQDHLDYEAALRSGADARRQGRMFLWATTGPRSRGYVSPVFLPDAGPCLECLLAHFERLSPAPELYGELRQHSREGGAVEPAGFPAPGVEVLASLAQWKLELLADRQPPAAVYRLHVLEAVSLEVASHPVLRDHECPCARR